MVLPLSSTHSFSGDGEQQITETKFKIPPVADSTKQMTRQDQRADKRQTKCRQT